VDDEEDLAYLMKEGLELGDHYEVHTFNDVEKALLEFKGNVYDLILIDILMPKINGFEFYKLIKEKDTSSRICFITASEYKEEEIKNLLPDLKTQNQKTMIIRKPIRLKELSRQVGIIINEEFK
jgi:DNA-binding response OmpR family regulator